MREFRAAKKLKCSPSVEKASRRNPKSKTLFSAQFDLIIDRIGYSGIKLVWSIPCMDPTKVARAKGSKSSPLAVSSHNFGSRTSPQNLTSLKLRLSAVYNLVYSAARSTHIWW